MTQLLCLQPNVADRTRCCILKMVSSPTPQQYPPDRPAQDKQLVIDREPANHFPQQITASVTTFFCAFCLFVFTCLWSKTIRKKAASVTALTSLRGGAELFGHTPRLTSHTLQRILMRMYVSVHKLIVAEHIHRRIQIQNSDRTVPY